MWASGDILLSGIGYRIISLNASMAVVLRVCLFARLLFIDADTAHLDNP